MVLSATYGGQNGWVQMGELCKPPDREGIRSVPQEVSSALNASFGVVFASWRLQTPTATRWFWAIEQSIIGSCFSWR